MCPTELLNNLKLPRIPDHQLKLKLGLAVILLCNINQTVGICNGARITITRPGNKYIEAEMITGMHVGEKVCIPRDHHITQRIKMAVNAETKTASIISLLYNEQNKVPRSII
jgi:hypothetical protein